VSSNAPVLIHLELRDVFQIVFFVSQREHYIFLEGIGWCHIPVHREGTWDPLLSSADSTADLMYYV